MKKILSIVMSSVILFNGTEVSFAENITNGNGKTTTSQETAEYYARKSIASGEKDYAILENLGDSGNVTSFVFGFNALNKIIPLMKERFWKPVEEIETSLDKLKKDSETTLKDKLNSLFGITAFTVLGSSIGYSLICLYQKLSDTLTSNTNKSKVEKTSLKDPQSILLENATPDENFLLKELQSVSLKKNISRKSKKDNKKILNVIKIFSAIIGAFWGFTYKLGLIKGRRLENENNLFDLEEKLLYANKAKQARLEELKMLLKQVKDMIAPSNRNFFEKSISSFDCIVYWFEKTQHSNVYFEGFFNKSDYTEAEKAELKEKFNKLVTDLENLINCERKKEDI